METPFPTKIATEEVDDIQTLRTRPGDMMEVDHFRNAGELPIGPPGQDCILTVPDCSDIDGGNPATEEQGRDPEHLLLGQPLTETNKGLQKSRIGKIGKIAIGCHIQIQADAEYQKNNHICKPHPRPPVSSVHETGSFEIYVKIPAYTCQTNTHATGEKTESFLRPQQRKRRARVLIHR